MDISYVDKLRRGSKTVFNRGDIQIPDDFDIYKFKRGQQFFKDNIFSCTTAMAVSLVLGCSVDRFMDVVKATWLPRDAEEAFSRYYKTYVTILKWHDEDVWDPASQAWRSIQKARTMHGRRHEVMKQKVGSASLYFSQYDMALGQCGFMGGIVLYGSKMGIVGTEADYDDYVYFWGWIGHIFGISEEFNICAHGYMEAYQYCKAIEREVLIPAVLHPPDHYHQFGADVIQGGKFAGLIVNLETLTAWSFRQAGIEGPPLSIGNRIRLAIFDLQFILVKYVPFVRSVLNKLVELSFSK